jgi:hypothetical protein
MSNRSSPSLPCCAPQYFIHHGPLISSSDQSSRIANALTPSLYSRIILHGPTQCLRTLDMLFARPDRARHIRSLTVNPDPPSGRRSTRWGRSALPDSYAVSSAVRRAAKHFEVLRCFAWDGEELPPYDDMWFALRILSVVVLPLSVFLHL